MRGLLLLALLPAQLALANPWDLYGYNPRAMAMASAQTAVADDFTAVYYNPAALTRAREAGFGFGLLVSRPALRLEFDKAEREIGELLPEGSDGVSFGAQFPLGGARAKNRVALGLALHVPTRSLLNGQALDPAIPHWYMYQSAPSRLVAMLGLGVMPVDWLSLGVGVQFLAGVSGSLDYELDIVAGRFSKKTVLFDIDPAAAPLVGLELRPVPELRVGASYRSAVNSRIDLPVHLDVTGIALLDVDTAFSVQYAPHQLALGASYDVAELGLLVALDLSFAFWSKAPDPSVSSSIDVGGDLFEGTGLGEVLDAPSPGQERAVSLAFRNVVVPRLGVEQRLGPLRLRAGYAVRPSPAPQQTSGTNYVDVTAHTLALGAGVSFHDPVGLLANPLTVDVAGALLFHPSRRYQKIDPDDPVGSYSAGGQVFLLGLAVGYEFAEAPVAEPTAAPTPAPVEGPAAPIERGPRGPTGDALPEGDGGR